MEFNFDSLMEDVFNLECSIKDKINILKNLEENFKETYRIKYIDLLSDFFYESNQFSDSCYDEFDEDNEEDMKYLLDHFEKFVVSYSKIIQYYDFANVEYSSEIWIEFNNWKNKRLDLIEYLNVKEQENE